MRRFLRFAQELLGHRSILAVLVQRDLKLRYQALGLGYLWSLLNPLLMLLVYSFVFSTVLASSIDDFMLFMASGLLPWIWFQGSLVAGLHSIIASGPLLRRRPLPAQLLPIVPVASQMVQFLTSLAILLVFLALSGRALTPALLFLPVVVLVQFVITYGATLAVATIAVRFRDIEYILGNLLMLLFFLAPIVYPWELVPERIRPLLLLNPITLITHTYQNILFFSRWPFWNEVWLLCAMAACSLAFGFAVFEVRRYRLAEQV